MLQKNRFSHLRNVWRAFLRFFLILNRFSRNFKENTLPIRFCFGLDQIKKGYSIQDEFAKVYFCTAFGKTN